MKEIILSHLTSRKFWLGLIIVIIGTILCATGDTENGVKLITIGGAGYLGVEGLADIISRINVSTAPDYEDEEPPADDCPSSEEAEG
mgnify:CR=1 FL=1